MNWALQHKRHQERERQLKQQLTYFELHVDETLREKNYTVAMKKQLKIMAIYSYKRGRLDR